jgi:hypothetical protein
MFSSEPSDFFDGGGGGGVDSLYGQTVRGGGGSKSIVSEFSSSWDIQGRA